MTDRHNQKLTKKKTPILFLDMDNTIVNHMPSLDIYKHIATIQSFPKNLAYAILGYSMKYALKLFWYIPLVVILQRKYMLTLFQHHRSDVDVFCKTIAAKVIEEFTNGLGKSVKERWGDADIYLISHCPDILAAELSKHYPFKKTFSLEMRNYFSKNAPPIAEPPENFHKEEVIKTYKNEGHVIYIADDLIDLRALKCADDAYIINASAFTRWYCRCFCRNITEWKG